VKSQLPRTCLNGNLEESKYSEVCPAPRQARRILESPWSSTGAVAGELDFSRLLMPREPSVSGNPRD